MRQLSREETFDPAAVFANSRDCLGNMNKIISDPNTLRTSEKHSGQEVADEAQQSGMLAGDRTN